VLPANEIQDPELRALQERNMDDLKQLGAAVLALPRRICSAQFAEGGGKPLRRAPGPARSSNHIAL
jgi:hypothetical protein